MVFQHHTEANAADVSDEGGLVMSSPIWDPEATAALQSQAVHSFEHGIVVVNDSLRSAKVNPAAAEILGIPAGFCRIQDLLAGLETLRLRCANTSTLEVELSEILASPESRISKWLWHVEEPAMHLHLAVAPIRTQHLAGRVWVFQDVSDLFDALHTVHSLKHRLRNLLTEGDVIAFRLRRSGEFDWVSPSTMRILGFAEAAYLGCNATDHCHPEDVPLIVEKVKTLRATREAQQVAFRVKDASGKVRSLEGRIFLAHDDPENIEVIMSDVTSHIELQHLRAQVTSAASHEFKTPLAFMSTALTMMEDGILDPTSQEGREAIYRMLSASGRLARMSDTLLTLQHLEITRSIVVGDSINPGRLVEQAVFTIPIERNITIDLRDHSDDICVHLDADLLEQAVINLVDNAVRHSPTNGVVEIVTRADGRTITISVRDRGPGVEEKFRRSIFEPFVRLNRDRDGAGLGLAIVQRIAHLHRGSIDVGVPDDGIGSIFTMTLTDLGDQNDKPSSRRR
ncbi:MAG: hypothetical protein RLZ37_1058 [Actinomycetota bacterium]|jgi:PAS domain S-box-containing protein